MQPIGFFEAHTLAWLWLLGLAIFPRITLLFIGGPFGFLHWLGWLFAPHLLVALMGTARYWDTNPWLCVIAWVVALVGSSGEGGAVANVAGTARRGVDLKREKAIGARRR
jgi:hypothetical protein